MSSFIEQAKAERAALMTKVSALDAVIAAYGDGTGNVKVKASAAIAVGDTRPPAFAGGGPAKRERVPLDRFSHYGQDIIRAAMEIVDNSVVVPVPTRKLVEEIEKRGLEIRGVDKVNALSALLARSLDLNSNGRRGWTLPEFDERYGRKPDENEAPKADADDASEVAPVSAENTGWGIGPYSSRPLGAGESE
jgi:hypothetical protein